MSNDKENLLVSRFFDEYKKATVDFGVTETGYELYAEEALPDWSVQIATILHILWVLASLAFSIYLYFSMASGFSSWQNLLIIPGLIVAFLLGSFFPASLIFSIILLIFSISFFPHWLFGGSLGLYALISLTKKLSRWYALDWIKRLALGCDENFITMLKKKAIQISPSKHTSKEATDLLDEMSSLLTDIR